MEGAPAPPQGPSVVLSCRPPARVASTATTARRCVSSIAVVSTSADGPASCRRASLQTTTISACARTTPWPPARRCAGAMLMASMAHINARWQRGQLSRLPLRCRSSWPHVPPSASANSSTDRPRYPPQQQKCDPCDSCDPCDPRNLFPLCPHVFAPSRPCIDKLSVPLRIPTLTLFWHLVPSQLAHPTVVTLCCNSPLIRDMFTSDWQDTVPIHARGSLTNDFQRAS